MTGIPAWIGASTGQPPLAAQINQNLGLHPGTVIYAGSTVATQGTAGSGTTASNGLYIAQSFTPSAASSLGRVVLTAAVTGSPGPITAGLYASSGGAPAGSALVSTVVPAQLWSGSAAAASIPLPYAVLAAASVYWIVLSAGGDASDYYAFSRSNQTSGTSTSTNGTAWSAQTYGLQYAVYSQAIVPPLVHTWEDSGARWTWVTTAGNGTPTAIREYTAAQGAGQYVYSGRTVSYSGPYPVTVA